MVDTLVSGTSDASRRGSNPLLGTILIIYYSFPLNY